MAHRLPYSVRPIFQAFQRNFALERLGDVTRGCRWTAYLLALLAWPQTLVAQTYAFEAAVSACSNYDNAETLDRKLKEAGLRQVPLQDGMRAIDWYAIPFEMLKLGLTTDTAKQEKRVKRLNKFFGYAPEKLAENGKVILTVSPQYMSENRQIYIATNITLGIDHPLDCFVFVSDAALIKQVWGELTAADAPAFDPAWAIIRGKKTAQQNGGIALAGLFNRAHISTSFQHNLKPTGYVRIINAHQPNSEANK